MSWRSIEDKDPTEAEARRLRRNQLARERRVRARPERRAQLVEGTTRMDEWPTACTTCQRPVSLTEDWTLWPWPDGKWLCARCNDLRHKVDDYTEIEARVAQAQAYHDKKASKR